MRVAHDTQWTYTATLDRLHDKANTAQPYANAAKENADANAHPSGPEAGNARAAVIMSVLWSRWPPTSAQKHSPDLVQQACLRPNRPRAE
jgi:hypothetical protein